VEPALRRCEFPGEMGDASPLLKVEEPHRPRSPNKVPSRVRLPIDTGRLSPAQGIAELIAAVGTYVRDALPDPALSGLNSSAPGSGRHRSRRVWVDASAALGHVHRAHRGIGPETVALIVIDA
jgi:hypothetical protein